MRGSMVMSSQEELETAYRDHRRGVFGMRWSPSASDADWLAAVHRKR